MRSHRQHRAERVLRFAGAPDPAGALSRVATLVRLTSVGKHRSAPAGALQEVVEIAKPELLSFGYLERDPELPCLSVRYSRFADDLLDRRRKGTLLASVAPAPFAAARQRWMIYAARASGTPVRADVNVTGLLGHPCARTQVLAPRIDNMHNDCNKRAMFLVATPDIR